DRGCALYPADTLTRWWGSSKVAIEKNLKKRRCIGMLKKIGAVLFTLLTLLLAGGAHLKWL
ncbi:MAG: hypothetical protein ACP5RW_08575, partial [bacterium]